MKTPLRIGQLAAIAALATAAGCNGQPAGNGTWYVDYEGGNDSANGQTQATAWKHAPGDLAATGRPAAHSLSPGDKIIFRAGVPYRGSLLINANGTAEKPIIFSGIGWGQGMAPFDGSDPVTAARPCTSAADCGGAPQWQNLWRVTYEEKDPAARRFLFGVQGMYFLSQFPLLDDPFYSDDSGQYLRVPVSAVADLGKGVLTEPALAKAAAGGGGQMDLALWRRGNAIGRVPLQRTEGDRLYFDVGTLQFVENREGRAAISGTFAGMARPGSFLILSPGVALIWPQPGETAATLSVGSGRTGVNFGRSRHLRFDGIHFRNFAFGRGTSGWIFGNLTGGSEDVQVRGSYFGPAVIEAGGGVVGIMSTTGFRLLSSRIDSIQFGSGIRTRSVNSDVEVKGNVMRRMGRTAIAFLSVKGGEISGNFLADLRGIHGNGITTYLANSDILVQNNCVVNTLRPLTFHGNRTPDVPNNITIRDNILVASADGQAAINGWGANTNGVVITNNVAIGPRVGISLNPSDVNVKATGNFTSSVTTRNHVAADWTVADNRDRISLADAARGSFTENGCKLELGGQSFQTSRAPQ